jgi:hypothetical protein
MGKWEDVLTAVLSGEHDSGIRFADLDALLRRQGFALRVRGSHHIFQRTGYAPINLQPDGAMAKPYQVRQVRRVLAEGATPWTMKS